MEKECELISEYFEQLNCILETYENNKVLTNKELDMEYLDWLMKIIYFIENFQEIPELEKIKKEIPKLKFDINSIETSYKYIEVENRKIIYLNLTNDLLEALKIIQTYLCSQYESEFGSFYY
jgi:hypothetical protein